MVREPWIVRQLLNDPPAGTERCFHHLHTTTGDSDDARISHAAVPSQNQPMPGSKDAMQPRPDHGEKTYKGSGKLTGLRAVITGGDSGIGRAFAIAYAREGADVLIAYFNETEEANEVKKLIEKEGRKAVLMASTSS
jgi:hypothetical protein